MGFCNFFFRATYLCLIRSFLCWTNQSFGFSLLSSPGKSSAAFVITVSVLFHSFLCIIFMPLSRVVDSLEVFIKWLWFLGIIVFLCVSFVSSLFFVFCLESLIGILARNKTLSESQSAPLKPRRSKKLLPYFPSIIMWPTWFQIQPSYEINFCSCMFLRSKIVD